VLEVQLISSLMRLVNRTGAPENIVVTSRSVLRLGHAAINTLVELPSCLSLRCRRGYIEFLFDWFASFASTRGISRG
jgi:hypothetical protein